MPENYTDGNKRITIETDVSEYHPHEVKDSPSLNASKANFEATTSKLLEADGSDVTDCVSVREAVQYFKSSLRKQLSIKSFEK